MSDSYFVLEIKPPDGHPSTREIRTSTTLIGRSSGEVVIAESGASGRHAELRFDGDKVTVADVGSTNGTLFRGALTWDPFVLPEGDSFQIGKTKFRLVRVVQPRPEPVAAPRAPAPPPPAALQSAPTMPVTAPRADDFGDDDEEKTSFLTTEPGAAPAPPAYGGAPVAPAPPDWGAAPAAPVPPAYGGAPAHAAAQPMAPVAPPAPAGGFGGDDEGEEKTAWFTPADDEPQPTMPLAPQGPPPTLEMDNAIPDWAAQAASPVAATPQPQMPTGDGPRLWFAGTGGELFVLALVQGLLTMITFGIYAPWMVCKIKAYMASRTLIANTGRGQVQLAFTGTGGGLFVKGLVGYLLTLLTLGIYGFWFACDLIRFFTENTQGHAQDGTRYDIRFTLTGGGLFKVAFVQYLLVMITFGIYFPWFLCKVRQLITSHVQIMENGNHVGGFQFIGTGGAAFGVMVGGYLLTMITFGIFFAWWQVWLMRFYKENTLVCINNRWYQGGFLGSGGQYFVLLLLHGLLVSVTLGIYMAWFQVKKIGFDYNNTVIQEVPT